MARESSVAPKERINVTFKPATGGAVEEIELPMKVMVLGDFLHRYDDRALVERKPVNINQNNFSDVMAKQDLSLDIAVPNKLREEESEDDIAVKLNITSMRDFEPGNIIDQVPELQKLKKLRDALITLKGPLGNMPAFRKALEGVLSDPRQRDQVIKELAAGGVDVDKLNKELDDAGKDAKNKDAKGKDKKPE